MSDCVGAAITFLCGAVVVYGVTVTWLNYFRAKASAENVWVSMLFAAIFCLEAYSSWPYWPSQ